MASQNARSPKALLELPSSEVTIVQTAASFKSLQWCGKTVVNARHLFRNTNTQHGSQIACGQVISLDWKAHPTWRKRSAESANNSSQEMHEIYEDMLIFGGHVISISRVVFLENNTVCCCKIRVKSDTQTINTRKKSELLQGYCYKAFE